MIDRPAAVVILLAALCVSTAALAQPTDPGQILADHPPRQAVERLSAMLDDAGDAAPETRFALGIARTLAAVETLGRDLHALGPRSEVVEGVPMLRLEVPANQSPPVVGSDDVRQVLDRFAANLDEVRATLEQIEGDVAVTVPVGRLGFDFDGDGETSEQETLIATLESLGMVNLRANPALQPEVVEPIAPPAFQPDDTPEVRQRKLEAYQAQQQAQFEQRRQRMQEQQAQLRRQLRELQVDFDTADVQWLIAYTHLIGGFADVMLAHDFDTWFAHCGHMLFQRVESPYGFLEFDQPGLDVETIGDVAAAIHLMRLPVRDAERLEGARQHFLSAARGAKRMFELARAETDDGREWIPNADQSAAFPNVEVTDEIIDAWLAFVDDIQGVLEGEMLIPFWRGQTAEQTGGFEGEIDDDGAALEIEDADDGASLRVTELLIVRPRPIDEGDPLGVNLRRVFEEQEELDAVLWLQGTAAAPYLETGKPFMTDESFQRMQQLTGGNFFTFAAWFN